MQLKFALLADYAALMENGKLMLAGDFDTIAATTEPIRQAFFLVGRFEASVSEGSEHTLKIGLFDADGHEVGRPMSTLPLKFTAGAPGRPLRAQVIARLVLEFPKFGDYEIHINIDGRNEGVVPLFITKHRKPHGKA